MKTMRWLPLPVLAAAFVVGCYPKAAPAPGAMSPASVEWAAAKWPGETEASLKAGRDLFLANCNKCHGYPDLVANSEEDWPSDVKRMASKADLTPENGDQILHYVLAARNEQVNAPAAKPAEPAEAK